MIDDRTRHWAAEPEYRRVPNTTDALHRYRDAMQGIERGVPATSRKQLRRQRRKPSLRQPRVLAGIARQIGADKP